jgi:hypothetical protein
MNELVLLQEWFAAQCDGDWEHGAGVRIESLDNPGWLVTIDLGRSAALEEDTVLVRARRSEHDWVDAEVRGGAFVGAGGPGNLTEILRVFLAHVGSLEHASS